MAKAKKKNPAAVALGRKGGKNSRANLTSEQRTELAQRAAAARWKDKPAAASAKVRAKKPAAKGE